MNLISNIWKHPKTSVAGLLICVATVAGVLSQQGITLGTAGTGTLVTLISALATALLGLLAKDPGSGSATNNSGSTGTQAKLGAWMLIVLLTLGTLPTAGCSASDVNKVVTEINAYLPTAVSLLNEAITIYSAVSTNGSDSASATSALTTVETDLTNLEKPLSDYLSATSSATKTTAWSNIKALVDTAVEDTDALLQTASVKNSNSRSAGVVVIASLDAAVHVIDGYVSSTESTSEVKAKASKRAIHLKAVAGYWSASDRQMIASTAGAPYAVALWQAEALGF